MTTDDAKKLLVHLASAYPHTGLRPVSMDTYCAFFEHLELEPATHAIERLIVKSKFFPSVAEIVREVAVNDLAIPSAWDAWVSILDKIKRSPEPFTDELGPVARHALNVVGGVRNVRNGQENGRLRTDFIAAYDAELERQIALRVEELVA